MHGFKTLVAAGLMSGLVGVGPALATTLNTTFTGTAAESLPFPVPTQVITINGAFSTYSASSDLPQLAGGDLANYSFTLSGTNPTYSAATNSATYGSTTGTINGYGAVVQDVSVTNLTVDFTTGAITGMLYSDGAMHPSGFPAGDIVDFTPADGASILGEYVPGGPAGGGLGGTVSGSITFVPEPVSLAILGSGLFGLVAVQRRKKIG
ncbi:PEP-CTERM sorting domain-containing protein [Acidisphaera sp. L21]|uniref:PEP-CTERM sorting domain-containing protein n=1 Tax=Acidisphaera sp. L21 TaxID=1641851 RepID=UPI00131B13A6|nr:PEP-CTERM sorting domain-containing protein [Acidisphaera sp. L21]